MCGNMHWYALNRRREREFRILRRWRSAFVQSLVVWLAVLFSVQTRMSVYGKLRMEQWPG
jgi:hypothetical protein